MEVEEFEEAKLGCGMELAHITVALISSCFKNDIHLVLPFAGYNIAFVKGDIPAHHFARHDIGKKGDKPPVVQNPPPYSPSHTPFDQKMETLGKLS